MSHELSADGLLSVSEHRRQIVLDTETTGLDVADSHRIIEVGAVEIVDRRLTGTHFHEYLQPDRAIDQGAFEVHGISQEFLADKPRFAAIVERFLAFIDGAELIIHNAAFDVAFIDAELRLCAANTRTDLSCEVVTDSLALARKKYPGQRNSLDALCRRLEIDNSRRKLHGALLDAEILADVYLRMTGGQSALTFGEDPSEAGAAADVSRAERQSYPNLPVIEASEQELLAHASYVRKLASAESGCVWQRLGLDADAPHC